mmetsp:Transcript_23665/g.67962  ORF Transcript_23665/g.67962 Transcript_23665/m.67962 type:complete len:585 (+) Transcript_23665:34-1788(+)
MGSASSAWCESPDAPQTGGFSFLFDTVGSPMSGAACCRPTATSVGCRSLGDEIGAGAEAPYEEEINPRNLQSSRLETRLQVAQHCQESTPGSPSSPSTWASPGGSASSTKPSSPFSSLWRWSFWRPVLMMVLMASTIVLSAFLQGWLDERIRQDEGRFGEGSGTPSLQSVLRYGSIPVVAAIIGYGTNVIALQMMFYPLEFVGFFPNARIGCGLDLPLFGWQGVIPMKAQEMAEISVDMMTQKLIKVEEVFSRLDPKDVAREVSPLLPRLISDVVNDAGRRHCPKLWEYLPLSVRQQLEDRVLEESSQLVVNFFIDLQKHISEVLDLKGCTVSRFTKNRQLLNDMFLTCGREEFVFIRNSGFYLGFFFGLLQMVVWLFVKDWWILPVCGVFVGYFTNVVALKVIFAPINPKRMCSGLTIQGLFLKRQAQVSALYSQMVAEKVLHASVLIDSLLEGPLRGKLNQIVDRHVAKAMEDVGSYYKPIFLLSVGADTWVDFRRGVCIEFRDKLPALMHHITAFAQVEMQLGPTLQERMEKLPPHEFERLLHAVFEQDEIKLILVGAILGAIVGLLQAIVQTPEQLGFSF